ncbi:MAG TPA: Asp-tRNA(Asn)/Glu-tRNA(Gln) amidotransferase subunit GatC [Opitutales bacterium]|nr:Asp-tRNA(Asn)/Glu-tRNA(Gln) amidotransferase subunit GatC [Opitutales bacterium]
MPDKPSIDIDHVANLARIHLSDEEKRVYSAQLGRVLDYFALLDQIDVAGVEPAAHAAPVYNVWREDVPGATMKPADVVMNAPALKDGQIVMPRVVSEE